MNKDICERYDASTLQQMYKTVTDVKNGGLKEKDVFPVSVIQAIFDGLTGTRLDHILSFGNCIYVPFQGTREATRLMIGSQMRRKGLIIVFRDLDNMTYTQRYLYADSVADEHWRYDDNWEDCFVGFGDLEFVEQLKQYLIKYIDEQLKKVLPPEGYELVMVNRSPVPPDGYEYVVYIDEDGKLVKVCTTDKEPIVRKVSKE